MRIRERLRFLLYGKLFAAVILITLLAWFAGYLLSTGADKTEEAEVSIVKVSGNEAADIVPLSSAHQSLVEIEGNYYGYARHFMHLQETKQLATQHEEAMLLTQRMQETIEQGLELANDLKEARLLQNSAAQAYLHKAAEDYLVRVQGWQDEATKKEKSTSGRYEAVEQNLLAAYRVLGYGPNEVTLYRGGLLRP